MRLLPASSPMSEPGALINCSSPWAKAESAVATTANCAANSNAMRPIRPTCRKRRGRLRFMQMTNMEIPVGGGLGAALACCDTCGGPQSLLAGMARVFLFGVGIRHVRARVGIRAFVAATPGNRVENHTGDARARQIEPLD